MTTKEDRAAWLGLANTGAPLRTAIVKLLAEVEALEAANMCDACAGTGTPTSGPGCMCGGSGRMSDAVHYLRERYAAEHVRVTALEGALETVLGNWTSQEIRDRARALLTPDPLRWALCAHDILYSDCKDPRCAKWLATERVHRREAEVTTTAICPDCLRPLTTRHRCPPKKYRVRARNDEVTAYGYVGSKQAAINLCRVLGDGATWEEVT